MYICPRCGSSDFAGEEVFVVRQEKAVIDVYCRNCNAWQGKLDQNISIIRKP